VLGRSPLLRYDPDMGKGHVGARIESVAEDAPRVWVTRLIDRHILQRDVLYRHEWFDVAVLEEWEAHVTAIAIAALVSRLVLLLRTNPDRPPHWSVHIHVLVVYVLDEPNVMDVAIAVRIRFDVYA